MSVYIQDFIFTDWFLGMMCDKNHGGTKNLLLRGNELIKKVGRRAVDNDMMRIVEFLWLHPEVVALELPYNRITCCGVSTIIDYLKINPTIRHLNLVGCDVGVPGVRKIVEMGEDLPLYTLRLAGNKIGKEGGILISKLLYMEIPLKFLDLSDTHQTMSSLAYLMTGLMPNRGGMDTLEIIDLGRPLGQYYHTMGSAHAAEFVGQICERSTNLKEIHVQQYNFDCHDIELLVGGLMFNNTLRVLDLNNNHIGDDGVLYLCRYLERRPALHCLMLGANMIKDLGARTLSFSMPYSRIRLLDLTNNLITDDGVLDLLHTLRKPVVMRGLFLWGNKMTHRSLVVMDRMLRAGTMDQERTDVRLYTVDGEFCAAWYPSANRYTHRMYCVKDYGHPPLRRIKMNPPKPEEEPMIYFKHHASDAELGMPLYEPEIEPEEEERIVEEEAAEARSFEVVMEEESPRRCTCYRDIEYGGEG